jgi:SAM-dependent methyltransferase
MKKDINFYNKESRAYSEKRYLGATDNFIKFFFKKRLSLFLYFLKRGIERDFAGRKADVLDIGCADGYVMGEIHKDFSSLLGKLTGIDTSPDMITEARSVFSGNPAFNFFIRGDEPAGQFDVIVELGVPLSDWREEFTYVVSKLTDGGIYIFSTPGSKNSLYSRIKKDFHIVRPLSFFEFNSLAQEFFEIQESKPYAFFIPLLWRFPAAARILQPFIEIIGSLIAPNLCHEKMYVLRKRKAPQLYFKR